MSDISTFQTYIFFFQHMLISTYVLMQNMNFFFSRYSIRENCTLYVNRDCNWVFNLFPLHEKT